MNNLNVPESNYLRLSSKDLYYKTLIRTYSSGYNDSIIEEVNDFSYLQRMFGDTRFNSFRVWFMIVIIAFGTSLIAAFIDIASYNIGYYKKLLAFSVENIYISFIIWVAISIFFVSVGTSFGYFFTPDADGSGIPEIKAIISGVELPRFLLWRTFFLKAIGLICCSASLSIGREGPHIHLAAIIAHKCFKHSFFQQLRRFKSNYSQLMQASVTAGVAAVMGTPVGATFFSIEITASSYIVHNLISALACGVACSIFLKLYHMIYLTEDFYETEVYSDFNNIDLILSCGLGILCGILGIFFIKATKFFTNHRSRRTILILHKRYRYAIFVAILYSIACFVIPTFTYTAKSVFTEMISKKDLDGMWEQNSVEKLLVFCIAKPFFTALSISVQIPFGIFLPILDSGAALGRAYGMLASYLGGIGHPSMYAAIGGASLISSSTHALSVALIIFEITNQIKYVIPVTLSVVISCSIAKAFELNIYDVSIQSRNIPFLPAVRKQLLYSQSAKDIMENVQVLNINSQFWHIKSFLHYEDSIKIPIVDNDMYIIAETSARRLTKYLDYCIESYTRGISEEIKKEIYKWRHSNEYEPPLSNTFLAEEIYMLLNSPIDFTSKIFSLNRDPISVPENMNLSKIHFMFHMLGLMKIYVTQKSRLTGIVKRENFTSCKK